MSKREQIKKLIKISIEDINNQLDIEDQIEYSDTTILFGRGGKLDSLGLINLIVAIEQNVEDEFDMIVTLANEQAMAQKHSPFETVSSLTNYIEILVDGDKDG